MLLLFSVAKSQDDVNKFQILSFCWQKDVSFTTKQNQKQSKSFKIWKEKEFEPTRYVPLS